MYKEKNFLRFRPISPERNSRKNIETQYAPSNEQCHLKTGPGDVKYFKLTLLYEMIGNILVLR